MNGLLSSLLSIIALAAVPLFLISFAAYLYFSRKIKNLYDPDLDDYYWEVEDKHPAIRKYERYARVALGVAAVAAMLLLLALVL